MEYRRITTEDTDAVARLAAEGLRPHLYPHLRFSEEKVRTIIGHFAASWTDFHLVAFDNGKVVAAIAVAVADSLIWERCTAHVVMCFTSVKGAGLRLIRAMLEWAKADFRIRSIEWPMEFDVDPRMLRLLQRHGFTRSHTVMTAFV